MCLKYDLNPLHNMWLLGTRAMFRSVRKFDKSGTGLVCKVCTAGGRKAADEFHFEDVKLECVYEFAYLGDMLNDTGGVEHAVAARVRASGMKFRELGGILCTREVSLRMKGVVYKACVCSVLTYGAETWAMKAGVFLRL